MYGWIVLSYFVLSVSMFETSKVSENVLKDNKGGEYDVIDVQIGNTDIAIIQKDGVILADEITSKDKEYSIIKYNRTCNVQFYEDTSDSKTCYEAFEDDVSIPNDTKTEIKEECGDLDIAYVKAVHCNTRSFLSMESGTQLNSDLSLKFESLKDLTSWYYNKEQNNYEDENIRLRNFQKSSKSKKRYVIAFKIFTFSTKEIVKN